MTDTRTVKTRVITAHRYAHPLTLIEDVVEGIKHHQIWLAFAWDETKLRYHRSIFGLLWIVMSYAMFVGGISIFFVGFSTAGNREFAIYVALSYATFMFLLANITDGAAAFTTSSAWIKSTNLPYSIYVFKSLFRAILPFGLQLLVAFTLILLSGAAGMVGWQAFWALLALVIFFVCAIPVQYSLGLIGARYNDVVHAIGAITRLLFFITPIIWVREEARGTRALLADLNPFTHFLEIFRNPLMGMEVRPISWCVVLGVTVFMWIFASVVAVFMRRRLPFWV